MADSAAMNSYKTRLFVAPFGTAAPLAVLPVGGAEPWDQIAEVISANGLPLNSSVTRLTHLESDNKAHEKIPGFMDAGQMTFRLNYFQANVLAQYTLLPDEFGATPGWRRYQWLMQFPDGGQWYCTGFVQGMPFDVPEDDRITTELTVEVSGYPVFYTN